jgi:uncharacterized surface protein with fasciclin (FAS1) repeats
MRTNTFRMTALAALAALSLTATACGDDGGDDTAAAGESAEETTSTTAAEDESSMDESSGEATMAQAVTEAGLVDTLNGEGPFTIFAPVNSAFAAIPAADLQAVLADKAMLTDILTLHVVQGEQLDSEALAEVDSVPTANGAEITIDASGESVMVNGQAEVVCANIPTANATVHLIDTVLMPQS